MSSLQEWLAAQREQLAQDRTVVVPVPGYEQRLAGRYRLITPEKAAEISDRSDNPRDRAADLLINTCAELLEITGPDEYASQGVGWTREGVEKVFGLALPDSTTSRQAVLAVFPDPLGGYKLLRHLDAVNAALFSEAEQLDEVVQGNSEAGSAAAAQSISQ